MKKSSSPYSRIVSLASTQFFSCAIYYIKPKSHEPKHYHSAYELLYVIKGHCKAHAKGKLYIYKKGVVHEVINDSKNTLVVLCITIPRETDKNTFYV